MGGTEGSPTFLTALDSRQLLRPLLKQLCQQQNLQLEELVRLFQETKGELNIPLSVFSTSLPAAEALCQYLIEEKKLSYPEIARLLHRNRKNIWATGQRAKKRKKIKKTKKPSLVWKKDEPAEKYFLPISLFQNSSFSLLESVVLYLHRTFDLTNPAIAKLLHKSPNSIAVIYKRAREKKIA